MRHVGIGLVYAYRYTLGLLFPASCKYHPSCSQYAIDALRRHGLAKGAVLAGWRLLRCNPWSHGGLDRVPSSWVDAFGTSERRLRADSPRKLSRSDGQ